VTLHQLVRIADGGEVLCLVCLCTWRTYPHSSACPGIPVLTYWPDGLMSKKQVTRYGGATPTKADAVCIYDNGEWWRQLFNPAAHGLTVITDRADLMTRDQLHSAGYSTAKTKIPPIAGCYRKGHTWLDLYDPAEAVERRMSKAQREALRRAKLIKGHTDDLRVALYQAIGGQCSLIRISHYNGRPGWIGRGQRDPQYTAEIVDGLLARDGGFTGAARREDVERINLGSTRDEAFATIREIATERGNTVDWAYVALWGLGS